MKSLIVKVTISVLCVLGSLGSPVLAGTPHEENYAASVKDSLKHFDTGTHTISTRRIDKFSTETLVKYATKYCTAIEKANTPTDMQDSVSKIYREMVGYAFNILPENNLIVLKTHMVMAPVLLCPDKQEKITRLRNSTEFRRFANGNEKL